MYLPQNSYAPSADTLYVDIKEVIEQKFPRLDQDIIDDAVAYARHQYTEYLLTEASEVASDREAETFFLRSVTERILEHNRREYDTLISLMLARERSNQTPLRSNKAQDLTSGFISLPSRPIEMIAEKIAEIAAENRKKFTPQPLKFPLVKYPIPISDVPPFLSSDSYRINQFWSLSYKLKRQIIDMAKLTIFLDKNWSVNWRPDLLIKMFDEIYRLAHLNLNANVLERSILESIMGILDSAFPRAKYIRINFIERFLQTINNYENIGYCRRYQELASNYS